LVESAQCHYQGSDIESEKESLSRYEDLEIYIINLTYHLNRLRKKQTMIEMKEKLRTAIEERDKRCDEIENGIEKCRE
jgi:hypothetical protein